MKRLHLLTLSTTLALIAFGSSFNALADGTPPKQPRASTTSDVDWKNFSGDSAQQYSDLTEINLNNIDELKLAWFADLECCTVGSRHCWPVCLAGHHSTSRHDTHCGTCSLA